MRKFSTLVYIKVKNRVDIVWNNARWMQKGEELIIKYPGAIRHNCCAEDCNANIYSKNGKLFRISRHNAVTGQEHNDSYHKLWNDQEIEKNKGVNSMITAVGLGRGCGDSYDDWALLNAHQCHILQKHQIQHRLNAARKQYYPENTKSISTLHKSLMSNANTGWTILPEYFFKIST